MSRFYPPKPSGHTYRAGNTWWKSREVYLQTKYGMGEADYKRMYAEQHGLCCICKQETKLVVDHCHLTGRVRGLLCNSCNYGLGVFKDNPQALRAAATYLKKKGHIKDEVK